MANNIQLWSSMVVVPSSFAGTLYEVYGKMKDFLQILQFHLKSGVRRVKRGSDWVFQQDTNPKHTSYVVLLGVKKADIKLVEWPQSPDLNPNENLWTRLQSLVCGRKPADLNELQLYQEEAQTSSQTSARSVLPNAFVNMQGTLNQIKSNMCTQLLFITVIKNAFCTIIPPSLKNRNH